MPQICTNRLRADEAFRPSARFNIQLLLDDFPQNKDKLELLDSKLCQCGKFAIKTFYCKKGEQEHFLSKSKPMPFHCEIRYCGRPDCLVQRFKRQLETFEDIKRLEGLNKLWHFAIGFEPVTELEFKKNFSERKKILEKTMRNYFHKLVKKGVNIDAIRVMDFSFVKEGYVYQHYHFGAIPKKSHDVRKTMLVMQQVRKDMIKRMRNKVPFHLQIFGMASKKAVFSYLAIRASGMYKYEMTKNPKYKHVQSNLKESIEKEKYLLLNQVLTKEEYLRSFYGKRAFEVVGSLERPPLHGSNITDGCPSSCPIHGELDRCDVRVEIEFVDSPVVLVNPPPPPRFDDKISVEIVRIS